MTTCPISFERLVRYWAHDLTDAEVDDIDEHLFTCASCFETAGRVAALATGVRNALPPISIERDIERARARGVGIVASEFLPGAKTRIRAPRGVDVLVLRLRVDDLVKVDNVALVGADGTPLILFDDAPFEPATGAVLVACQRHFAPMFSPAGDLEITFVVRGTDARGAEASRSFTIAHGFD